MRCCHERLELVVKPDGVVGLATVISGAAPVRPGGRVGVVLSGGNVDAERFCAVLGSINL
jgi:threonine dehydratase